MSPHTDEDLRRLFDDAAATIPALSPGFTDTVMTQGSQRRRTKKRSLLAAVAAVLAVVIGAASQSPGLINDSAPQPADTEQHFSPPGSRSELRAALLGRWEQTSTCQQRVDSLTALGYGSGNGGQAPGWGLTSPRNKISLPGVVGPSVDHHVHVHSQHPCSEATPETDVRIFESPSGGRPYYLVRAPEGLLVQNLASFRVVDPQTVALKTPNGLVTRSLREPHQDAERDAIIWFHVRMLSPNTMALDPVLPSCVETPCYAAAWAVAVANSGQIWHRVS